MHVKNGLVYGDNGRLFSYHRKEGNLPLLCLELGEYGGNVLLTNYGDLDASININTIKDQGLYGISTNPGSPTQFAKMLVIERAGRIRQFVMATIASVAVYSRCFANNEWGAWHEVTWHEVS